MIVELYICRFRMLFEIIDVFVIDSDGALWKLLMEV